MSNLSHISVYKVLRGGTRFYERIQIDTKRNERDTRKKENRHGYDRSAESQWMRLCWETQDLDGSGWSLMYKKTKWVEITPRAARQGVAKSGEYSGRERHDQRLLKPANMLWPRAAVMLSVADSSQCVERKKGVRQCMLPIYCPEKARDRAVITPWHYHCGIGNEPRTKGQKIAFCRLRNYAGSVKSTSLTWKCCEWWYKRRQKGIQEERDKLSWNDQFRQSPMDGTLLRNNQSTWINRIPNMQQNTEREGKEKYTPRAARLIVAESGYYLEADNNTSECCQCRRTYGGRDRPIHGTWPRAANEVRPRAARCWEKEK